jgi:hypothetical protein
MVIKKTLKSHKNLLEYPQRGHKNLYKEITKSFLKKTQKAVTVAHICQLLTDKSLIKSVTKLCCPVKDRFFWSL